MDCFRAVSGRGAWLTAELFLQKVSRMSLAASTTSSERTHVIELELESSEDTGNRIWLGETGANCNHIGEGRKKKTKLRGLCPLANYADRAIAFCRRS